MMDKSTIVVSFSQYVQKWIHLHLMKTTSKFHFQQRDLCACNATNRNVNVRWSSVNNNATPWSGLVRLHWGSVFLSAAVSNAGRQILMNIYMILHSLNSMCKTSPVDMKFLFQLCSNDGLPLEGIWRLLRPIKVFWYSPTLPGIIIFCFWQCDMYPVFSSLLSKRRSYFVTLW